jgi:hypothetical protein
MNAKKNGFTTRARLLALAGLVVAAGACRDSTGPEPHADAARVELHTRGAQAALLATWTDANGWRDANNNPITELPAPVAVEGQPLQPLVAGGRNASLTVRFFEADGSEIQISTLSRGPEPARVRQCSEYSARYYAENEQTTVIAWPNRRHSAAPDGELQFAVRHTGEEHGIFHCDHVHFYPEAPGTADVRFHLWHIDHSDGATDPIRIRVEPAAQPARIEIATRGVPSIPLGVWTAGQGWRDPQGNALTRIPAARFVEGEGLVPIRAGGPQASLNVRFVAHGGGVADIRTAQRDAAEPRNRTCTYVSAQYAAATGSANLVAWPNIAHPTTPQGPTHFARRANNDVVGIFHCDHLHIYPEAAGDAQVRFRIVGGERTTLIESDPITFAVQPGS